MKIGTLGHSELIAVADEETAFRTASFSAETGRRLVLFSKTKILFFKLFEGLTFALKVDLLDFSNFLLNSAFRHLVRARFVALSPFDALQVRSCLIASGA